MMSMKLLLVKEILKPVLSLMSFPVFIHFLMKDEVMNEILHVRIF